MTKRITAIVFIFIFASVAWAILGGTIFSRTYSLDEIAGDRVASTWGTPQNQAPPVASYKEVIESQKDIDENGKHIPTKVKEEVVTKLPLEGSNVDVGLDLEHRQKGFSGTAPTKSISRVTINFITQAIKSNG